MGYLRDASLASQPSRPSAARPDRKSGRMRTNPLETRKPELGVGSWELGVALCHRRFERQSDAELATEQQQIQRQLHDDRGDRDVPDPLESETGRLREQEYGDGDDDNPRRRS